MRLLLSTTALTAGLALTALTLPAIALGADETPPKLKVLNNAAARCDDEPVTKFRVRVSDPLPTRTVVRLDGEVVRESARERFAVRLRLGKRGHRLRIVARDEQDNRFVYRLVIRRCG
jgi:hypothetical protein